MKKIISIYEDFYIYFIYILYILYIMKKNIYFFFSVRRQIACIMSQQMSVCISDARMS